MNWEIILYETSNGQPVVERFIDSLQRVPHAKLLRVIDLLEVYGVELGMPHSRALGNGLYELRVRGKIDVRTFYVFASNNRIYILHGFIKNSKLRRIMSWKLLVLGKGKS